MAKPTCPKCGNHKLEVTDHEPANLIRRIQFVQCASCGVVVGVLDPWCHDDILSGIAKKLDVVIKR